MEMSLICGAALPTQLPVYPKIARKLVSHPFFFIENPAFIDDCSVAIENLIDTLELIGRCE